MLNPSKPMPSVNSPSPNSLAEAEKCCQKSGHVAELEIDDLDLVVRHEFHKVAGRLDRHSSYSPKTRASALRSDFPVLMLMISSMADANAVRSPVHAGGAARVEWPASSTMTTSRKFRLRFATESTRSRCRRTPQRPARPGLRLPARVLPWTPRRKRAAAIVVMIAGKSSIRFGASADRTRARRRGGAAGAGPIIRPPRRWRRPSRREPRRLPPSGSLRPCAAAR